MSDNITLFCFVEGDSKEKVFGVTTGINDYVSNLKKIIKNEKSNLFVDIDANDIVLWKVNIPIDENAMEYNPYTKIINVFSENVADNFIHIMVERPIIMSDNITLFCFVEGDSKEKVFGVTTGINDYVSNLKKIIKNEKSNLFVDIDANDIVLWKVNIPIDENAMEYNPYTKIINVFSENVADNFIHIMVERPIMEQGKFFDVFSKIEELNIKIEQGFKKVHNVMDGSLYSTGTVTETDKGKEVQTNGTEISFPFKITTSIKSKPPGRFTEPPNKNPKVNAKEKDIQDYFMNECKAIENSRSIKNKHTVEDTRNLPILGTRKPDFVFIPKNSDLNCLNVTAVGEIKPKKDLSFNNNQIGIIISFGEKLLQLQPRRNFVFVILTDCITISIFKVTKFDNYQKSITQFKYKYITPQCLGYNNNNNNGWKYLVSIMESSSNDLGWVEPLLTFSNEVVNLIHAIGVGRTSIVYEGKYNDLPVAVKMAKKIDYLQCFKREKNVLEKLLTLNSPHIPKIIFSNDNTLIITPLGRKINNFQKKDIKDIITTLQKVHLYKIVHRDLRKYNFLRDEFGNILIIDWGYSIIDDEVTTFAGALECMPNEILKSVINGNEMNIYGPEVDLMCFVRSFYLMLHRPSLERFPFDKNNNIQIRAQSLLEFWNDHGKSDVWSNIYNAIKKLDYNKLIQELERFF
ncbi:hypothetical protein Glove_141g119 [Diversispora epigaea]|uniref:Protein kinase domain-containing protein n=1 Tax=Diversispora epigaea TaxID=1348612 RepID=A0A397IZC4_9GLOM|nr:hypothetical protein Glove_141g119 [Diversispora epigaea]